MIIGAAPRALRLPRSLEFGVVMLVVANLVPFVGVVFQGWDLGMVLTLYWIENGVVGAINIAKMWRATGDPVAVAWPSRLYQILAFTFNYGAFWVFHGVFVGIITSIGQPGVTGGGLGDGAIQVVGIPLGAAGLDPLALGLGALALVISHGIAFFVDFLGAGQYRTTTVEAQSNAPYGRMLVLHGTIVIGAFALAMLGATAGPIAVMVVLKLALDLSLHLRARAMAAARPSAHIGRAIEA